MTTRISRVMCTLTIAAAVVGVLTGLLAPKSAHASLESFSLELWPGGGSTLTCGWHSGPCYDNDSLVSSGGALDWAGQSTITSVFRATMSSSLFANAGTGYATVGTQSSCLNYVVVDVSDVYGGFQTGTHYYHTWNSIANGTTWNINAASGYWTSTNKTLGSTASEAGCGETWSGYHVHQLAGSGWTLRSYPDHSTCNVDEAPVTNNVSDCWVGAGYKQADRTWWLNTP